MRLLLLVLVASLAACTSQNNFSNSILNPDALPTQSFAVSTTKDTVLKTKGGVLIQIAAGSFSGGGAEDGMVDLAVKEALRFDDILKAGLTTQTANGILRSDGMISIEAVGDDVSIAKPVAISIPTNEFDAGMQVFSGESENGSIEWSNPRPLQDTMPPWIEGGRHLFVGNCATCHALDKVVTGPALLGVEHRGPWTDRKVLFDFTRNPGLFSAGSPYMKCQISEYGQLMPAFPQLSDTALGAIYDYIRYEEVKRGLTYYRTPCEDSCRRYDSAMRALHAMETQRQMLVVRNGVLSRVDYNFNPLPQDSGNASEPPPTIAAEKPDLVELTTSSASYYQFNIDAFGWYNVDRLLKEDASLKESRLTVNLQGEKRTDVDIYLAIPSLKIFTQAGRTRQQDEYAFLTKDGKLPLPQGAEAFVFAMSEGADGPMFGFKRFIIGRDQTIAISVQTTTKDSIQQQFTSFNFDGVAMKVEDTKNATEIRQLDKGLREGKSAVEALLPKGCGCGCPNKAGVATDSISSGNIMEVIPATKPDY